MPLTTMKGTKPRNTLWWTLLQDIMFANMPTSDITLWESSASDETPKTSKTTKTAASTSSQQLPGLTCSDLDLRYDDDEESESTDNQSSFPSLFSSLSTWSSTSHSHTRCSASSAEEDDDDKLMAFCNGRETVLTLHDFVEQSSAQDRLALAEALESSTKTATERTIQFVDTVPGNAYRRWQFKKTGVYRHILKVAKTCGISVQFDTKAVVTNDSMSFKALVSLLEELKKDCEVTTLYLDAGVLHPVELERITMALVTLLKCDDRVWESLQVRAHVLGNNREAQMVSKVCQRALEKVAREHYVPMRMSIV